MVAKIRRLDFHLARETLFQRNVSYESADASVALLVGESKREDTELRLMGSDGLGFFASNSWYAEVARTVSSANSRVAEAALARDAGQKEARCSLARRISAERNYVAARATERINHQKTADSSM